ncbi:MAG: DUF123 domain-containing protein [candidate division Zixibacteria bacterium HGW-Zixibacteria-1]|nr:MAG: DUF123 domain-containing protein [candidate division Zixibacteria bacterium HGW-Zixibacteria-1]
MTECGPDSGCYQIVTRLDSPCKVRIGALGIINFETGFYIYTGRAQKGLQMRVQRHLRHRKKKFRHIDYLLEKLEIVDIFYFHGRLDECIINMDSLKSLKNARIIKKFGSSDCRCPGHLIWTDERPST